MCAASPGLAMTEVDIIIVGAGPAGMSAARYSAEGGARVLLIDEQATPGGQIYRAVQNASKDRLDLLGADYAEGVGLVERLANTDVTIERSATVWRVDEEGTVTYSVAGQAKQARGRHLILATGALERAMPIPGWTLPGVMTAGAAQTLLKDTGVVPEGAVLAGSGPLLYLVASQLIKAGAPPKAMIETQTFSNYLKAVKYLPGALRAPSYLLKGRELLKQIRRAGILRYTGARRLSITGEDAVSGITFSTPRQHHKIICETVLLHGGVVPNIQITRSLRLDHDWDHQQYCFKPRCDINGMTSSPAISVAGDGAGIGGARAAAIQGKLSALAVLEKLGLGTLEHKRGIQKNLQLRLSDEMAIRPFLDALYAPPQEILRPVDDVIICRCEDVTAGDIRQYARLGCTGPNQAKAFGRSGMGPCQGRYCGLTVTELLAEATGITRNDVGYYRLRSPLKPVTLGELASLASGNDEKETE